MTDPPPHSPTTQTQVAPLMRGLGIVMLVLPVAGTVVNVALLAGLVPEWAQAYRASHVLAAGMLLSVVVLFGSHFHYRRTRMRIDIASRIAANLWLFSSVWLFWSLIKPG